MRLWNKIEISLWIMWPLVLPAYILVLHILIIGIFDQYSYNVNKYFAFTLQCTGAILIVYSINSNLFSISNISILKLITEDFEKIKNIWIAKPLISGVNIEEGCDDVGLTCDNLGDFALFDSFDSDQKLIFLKNKIQELNNSVVKEICKIKLDLNKEVCGIYSELGLVDRRVGENEQKLKECILGGVRCQICGVLLGMYGAYLNL